MVDQAATQTEQNDEAASWNKRLVWAGSEQEGKLPPGSGGHK